MSWIQSVVYLPMGGNISTNRRPGNGRNSAECQQWLIRPGEANEFAHHIWTQSDQWFVFWNCMETAQQIRGQETAQTEGSVTRSLSGQGRPMMSLPTKFELRGLSANAQKLPKIRGQKMAGIEWSMILCPSPHHLIIFVIKHIALHRIELGQNMGQHLHLTAPTEMQNSVSVTTNSASPLITFL